MQKPDKEDTKTPGTTIVCGVFVIIADPANLYIPDILE